MAVLTLDKKCPVFDVNNFFEIAKKTTRYQPGWVAPSTADIFKELATEQV